MNLISVTLGDLVDRTLFQLQSAPEQGRVVTLATALTASDTLFSLTNGDLVNVSDIVEFGTELVQVTDKSQDLTPIFTVARGYYGTTGAAHGVGDHGILNPTWPRVRVARAVQECFVRLEALGLPVLKAGAFFPTEGIWPHRLVIEMPQATRDVWSVRNLDFVEVPRWEFVDDLPVSEYSTGKVIRMPRSTRFDDEVYVTYRIPYRWSSFPDAPSESSLIELPEGAEDLPASYAVAWLTSAREVSRAELDRAGGYAGLEPARQGVTNALVRARWQEFYRSLDEARRLDPLLPRRPFVKRVH